jgi:TatD DNase family protein
MFEFCDTHAHLDFDSFDEDLGAVIERARLNSLQFIINIAIDLESSHKSLALARQYPGFIFSTIGIHPNYTQDADETTFTEIEHLALHKDVVAIGEIGLDYYRDYATPLQQTSALEVQLDLAQRLELPIVIHERD